MNPAPSPAFYEPPLAAKPQLREKPHQGLPSKNPTWNQGPNVCNFTVTLGLRATVVENGVRETYSARYYNPNTGRFMSRDPEDGKAADPKSLHKYLYAGGDPVNGWDPTGRSDLAETGIVTFTDALKVVWYAAKVICFEIKWIGWITTGIAKATGGTPPLPWWLTFGCTPIGGFGFPSL